MKTVSMPCIRLPSFLLCYVSRVIWDFGSVNALYQASFISTLFLQNPLKSRVLTAYFACNCLNILTIMLFA